MDEREKITCIGSLKNVLMMELFFSFLSVIPLPFFLLFFSIFKFCKFHQQPSTLFFHFTTAMHENNFTSLLACSAIDFSLITHINISSSNNNDNIIIKIIIIA
jgi:hypothetical protein